MKHCRNPVGSSAKQPVPGIVAGEKKKLLPSDRPSPRLSLSLSLTLIPCVCLSFFLFHTALDCGARFCPGKRDWVVGGSESKGEKRRKRREEKEKMENAARNASHHTQRSPPASRKASFTTSPFEREDLRRYRFFDASFRFETFSRIRREE